MATCEPSIDDLYYRLKSSPDLTSWSPAIAYIAPGEKSSSGAFLCTLNFCARSRRGHLNLWQTLVPRSTGGWMLNSSSGTGASGQTTVGFSEAVYFRQTTGLERLSGTPSLTFEKLSAWPIDNPILSPEKCRRIVADCGQRAETTSSEPAP